MAIRRSWVVRIASDPVCYLWTGPGPLQTPADYVDPLPPVWDGAAELLSVPALRAIINGAAERIEFLLSGVSAETLRLAQADVASIRMAECRVGRVDFDDDWQVVGGVAWEWIGYADALRVQSRASDGERSRSITLMIGSADTFRANPNFTYWTDASQRLRSPDDAFCDQVASIAASITRRFGPK